MKTHRKKISFNTVKYDELLQIVDIQQADSKSLFEDWFGYNYSLSNDEHQFIEQLIHKYKYRLSIFSEEELKAKFIIPILNLVDFYTDEFKDWYERPLKAEINGVEIGGMTDFMVAQGYEEPRKPYFFIQEFKRSRHEIDPRNQLLAELLVAIEQNQHQKMYGSYVIGQIWKFLILEKVGENTYLFYESKAFDSLWFDDLKQIYINLQAVKVLYCKD